MTVATFIAIKNAKQTRGAMAGAMGYVAQDEKTLWRGIPLVAGHNCVPQSSYIEFLTTKKRFHKTDGRQFYHFVQSFADLQTAIHSAAVGSGRPDPSKSGFSASLLQTPGGAGQSQSC